MTQKKDSPALKAQGCFVNEGWTHSYVRMPLTFATHTPHEKIRETFTPAKATNPTVITSAFRALEFALFVLDVQHRAIKQNIQSNEHSKNCFHDKLSKKSVKVR